MIAKFTLQKEEMLCRAVRAMGRAQGTGLSFFDKSIFEQEHAQNATKGAKIDVSELLKLQKVLLCFQPWLEQS